MIISERTTKIVYCETAEVIDMSPVYVFHGSQLNFTVTSCDASFACTDAAILDTSLINMFFSSDTDGC